VWCRRIVDLLNERNLAPPRWMARREAALDRARLFTWPQFTARVVQVYDEVAARAEATMKGKRRQKEKGRSEVTNCEPSL
jgi:hypothetical protein